MPLSAFSAAANTAPAHLLAGREVPTSWVIFIDQSLDPHIEQKWAVAPSAGRVWS